MENIRKPAVAGMFYPADPEEIHSQLADFFRQAAAGDGTAPKALIAPHAGYIYSGPVAASAYIRLKSAADTITRVILLGPSHRVAFPGLATPSADAFRTPLGDIPLDREAVEAVEALPQVHRLDEAHLMEHSLEVHLPFLQELLHHFTLVPLVVGDADSDEVAEVLEMLWGGPETLIVISSDLSHYHDYATAQEMDRTTSEAIEGLHPEALHYDDACGRNPIKGLLTVARRKAMHMETVDLRNSGDTAGPRDRVVGYGSYVLH